MVNNAKARWPRLARFWQVILRVWHVLVIIFLITLGVVLLMLVMTDFYLCTGAEWLYCFKWPLDHVLGWLGTDSVKLTDSALYGRFIQNMLLFFAYGVAVPGRLFMLTRERKKHQRELARQRNECATELNKTRRKHRRELADERNKLEEEYGITITPVKEKGKDDLEWMLLHYNTSEQIRIFAGSFEWLPWNKDLRDRVVTLAKGGNAEFVSYRTKEQVQAHLSEDILDDGQTLYDALKAHFTFESGLRITCTLTTSLNAKQRFLYRSLSSDEGGPEQPFNACALLNANHGELLGRIVRQFIKARRWGILEDQSSPDDQDANDAYHDRHNFTPD